MNVNTLSPNHQNLIDKARENLKRIEDRGVSKAETLEDLRDTAGKSFRTSDLEKLMEKYDPESYAKYSKMSRTADGARSQGGLAYLSSWIDNVKVGLKNGSISSEGTSSAAKKDSVESKNSLLNSLQEKYSSINITAGFFSKNQISSQGKGFQGVIINPAYLAKAENDPQAAKDLDEMLSGVESAQKWLQDAFARDGLELVSSGFYIDEKGNMSSWSVVNKKSSLFDGLTEQKAKDTEKAKDKKAEKKEQQEKLEEKRKASKEEKAKLKEKMEEANKAKFGDKFKEAIVIMKNDEKSDDEVEKDNGLQEEREIGDILDFNA